MNVGFERRCKSVVGVGEARYGAIGRMLSGLAKGKCRRRISRVMRFLT